MFNTGANRGSHSSQIVGSPQSIAILHWGGFPTYFQYLIPRHLLVDNWKYKHSLYQLSRAYCCKHSADKMAEQLPMEFALLFVMMFSHEVRADADIWCCRWYFDILIYDVYVAVDIWYMLQVIYDICYRCTTGRVCVSPGLFYDGECQVGASCNLFSFSLRSHFCHELKVETMGVVWVQPKIIE